MNRVLVTRDDGVDGRIMPRAQTVEPSLSLYYAKVDGMSVVKTEARSDGS